MMIPVELHDREEKRKYLMKSQVEGSPAQLKRLKWASKAVRTRPMASLVGKNQGKLRTNQPQLTPALD
jgi:hypothetical protein